MKQDTKFKGIAKIGDNVYSCYVIDGVRYIDGKTVDEFIKTLDKFQLLEMAIKGNKIYKSLSNVDLEAAL